MSDRKGHFDRSAAEWRNPLLYRELSPLKNSNKPDSPAPAAHRRSPAHHPHPMPLSIRDFLKLPGSVCSKDIDSAFEACLRIERGVTASIFPTKSMVGRTA